MVGREKKVKAYRCAIKFSVDLVLATPLLIKSGLQGDFTDSSIEKTSDGKLHINGYVWSSLLRRALLRLNGGKQYAGLIGKYDEKQTPDLGVSPLWCESSFVNLVETDIRPGNRIDRKYGTGSRGALYSDEIVPPGHNIKLNFNYFLKTPEESDAAIKLFQKALSVVHEGIENIGGGWSYGFGRLRLADSSPIKVKKLKLEKPKDIWEFENIEWDKPESGSVECSTGDISKNWRRFTVHAGIADGQLLAVHSKFPLLDKDEKYPEMPDSYVYRRYQVENGKAVAKYVVPGKTIRQALLSTQIERKLRTAAKKDEPICLDSTKQKVCTCKRCLWFGNTGHSGIIAVSDAVVDDGAEPVILHRIQLCEHSMQNMNLFDGEYLKNGKFKFDIWIDYSRSESEAKELENEIELLLSEIKKDSNAPPGWYRIGATSTCTGQLAIITDGKEKAHV